MAHFAPVFPTYRAHTSRWNYISSGLKLRHYVISRVQKEYEKLISLRVVSTAYLLYKRLFCVQRVRYLQEPSRASVIWGNRCTQYAYIMQALPPPHVCSPLSSPLRSLLLFLAHVHQLLPSESISEKAAATDPMRKQRHPHQIGVIKFTYPSGERAN